MFTCRFQQYQLTVECDTTEDGSGDGVGCEGGRHLRMGALLRRREKFITHLYKLSNSDAPQGQEAMM